MIGPEELDRRFDFHPADTEDRQSAHMNVRTRCKSLARRIDELCPDGREKSLAITALEEAMMWANAAIARPPTTSSRPPLSQN